MRLFIQVVAAILSLVLADQIAHRLVLENAAGLVCLAALAAVVVCVRLGWRHALLGLVGLALLSIPAALSQGDPLTATAVMAFTAFAVGISARWTLHQAYWLMVVSVCLLITNNPFAATPSVPDVVRLVSALLLSGGLAILLQRTALLRQQRQASPAPFRVVHSWRRSAAYGLLLATTTLFSVPVALHQHWHITGLWLILTPFLVLRPFVRDAWMVALHRSLGTLAGVLLVTLLAWLLPKTLPLPLLATLVGGLTALIAIRRGHPALMLMALTITIVLFNSTHADLLQMADRRLLANALGVALALGVMAIAHPIEHRLAIARLSPTS